MQLRSRKTWLSIIFAMTAVVVLTIQITQYTLQRRNATYLPVGYRYYPGVYAEPMANYSKIEEGLWMGGYVERPPKGTQAVLNVCESEDLFQVESVQWDPIHDGPPAPSLDWLRRQLDFISSERSAGRTVYVHCHAGVSRSGMVMTAYFMRREGWSAKRALDYLRIRRPAVNPNPAFTPLLAEWERTLKSQTASPTATAR